MSELNLATWAPQLIVNIPGDLPGTIITSERWIELWQLSIGQGDYTGNSLRELMDNILTYRMTTAEELAALTLALEGKRDVATALDHNVLTDITGTDAADCHPISAITNLQTVLDGISAGALGVFSHNDIGSRDAVDAHPISAITGLATAIGTLETVAGWEHNDLPARDAASAHPATSIVMADATTVQAKIASILSTIASITGNIEEITHNNLAGRSTSDAHPMTAITGLTAALAVLTNAINVINTSGTVYNSNRLGGLAAASWQRKITASTSDPSGGTDGDVWVKYA